MGKEPISDNRLLNRRAMLKAGALAAGAATLTHLGACGAQVKEQAPAPKEEALKAKKPTKNMKLSLAAYSMRQALTSGEMDLFGFIDWCAEMDLPGTELTSYYFKEGFDNKYLQQLKLHAFRQGVTVSGTAIRNDFCKPPGAERNKEIEQAKKWIDYAAALSAPHIRIFAGNVPKGVENKTAIGWVAECTGVVLAYAAQKGVVLGLENHGGITARAADHLAICDAVEAAAGENKQWFGVNLDTGNYHTDCYEELAMAAPRAVNVQVKVEVVQNDGTKVLADLARVRDILVNANYKGWVALEYEAEADPRVEIPMYMEKLKGLFGV
ncbi:MAG TPA: sugar phosphate isomerase/epimerase family protein [archaeon]|nr:sugar phosphate isomerase/epimerase family protein [archaeon]